MILKCFYTMKIKEDLKVVRQWDKITLQVTKAEITGFSRRKEGRIEKFNRTN